jgi:hypothetical protein
MNNGFFKDKNKAQEDGWQSFKGEACAMEARLAAINVMSAIKRKRARFKLKLKADRLEGLGWLKDIKVPGAIDLAAGKTSSNDSVMLLDVG